MAIRLPTREWTTTVETISDGFLGITTHPFAIIDNVLWYGGTANATSGFDSLIGISAGDGSLVAEIEIRSLLEITSDAGAYSRSDMGVDHNGYIWLDTQSSGFISGRSNFIVVDPANRSIVTTIGTAVNGQYGNVIKAADRPNKLMWIAKTATQIDAFDTEIYSVSHSITIINAGGTSFAVNEDKDELWVYTDSENSLKIYRSSTGDFLRNVSGTSTVGVQGRISMIPEKNIMLFTTGTVVQTFSLVTYTLVSSITVDPIDDAFVPMYYSPHTNEIYGYYFDDSASEESVGFYDLDTLTANHFEVLTGDQLTQSGVTGTDGSVYFGTQNSGANIDSIHKLVFSVLDDDTALTGSGGGSTDSVGASGLFTNIPDIYNRELIFDIDLGAFYVHDLGHTAYPAPISYVDLPGFALGTEESTIMAGNDVVLVTSGDTVVIDGFITIDRTTEPRGENFKYVCLAGTDFTLADYKDFSFKDFVSYDSIGKYFDSYIVTGYDISTDLMRKKRAIYLLVYNERTETVYTLDEGGNVVLARQSGCLIQPQWDWNTSMAQGKWGQSFQAYRMLRSLPSSPSSGDTLDYGERVIMTKNKLRGSGRALSLLIRSQDGKDMRLLGWALDITKQDIA